ncbi:MAG: hypothetical protein JXA71_07115, partial [Chitinispirillaceae bacterium]|nr:hypothetical protein [Chitinispirillaceae bacterium]
MSKAILYLGPEHITPAILLNHIYPDFDHDYYWSDCWSPDFYADLARTGFIPIADRTHEVLIPEMQKSYAVLDWTDLHASRHIRKIIRSGLLADEDLYLIVDTCSEAVIGGIRNAYGHHCWLIEPYAQLIRLLASRPDDGFSTVATELWSGKRRVLLGGELGYTVG